MGNTPHYISLDWLYHYTINKQIYFDSTISVKAEINKDLLLENLNPVPIELLSSKHRQFNLNCAKFYEEPKITVLDVLAQ